MYYSMYHSAAVFFIMALGLSLTLEPTRVGAYLRNSAILLFLAACFCAPRPRASDFGVLAMYFAIIAAFAAGASAAGVTHPNELAIAAVLAFGCAVVGALVWAAESLAGRQVGRRVEYGQVEVVVVP